MWLAVTKPFKNINLIFPTKQKDVRKMIEVCKKDKNIRKIIIFGSSTTSLCTPWSDIDIYFEFKKEPNSYPSTGSNNAVFDKWDNFTVDDRLLDEIKKTGVVVFER